MRRVCVDRICPLFVSELAFLYIWARFAARLYADHPSPVLNACGFAVWASRIIPNPSENGSKSTIRSYLTLNFFSVPEKYGS